MEGLAGIWSLNPGEAAPSLLPPGAVQVPPVYLWNTVIEHLSGRPGDVACT